MGFVLMHGRCVHCYAVFGFNPLRVPSVVVDGKREPLCRACVEWANAARAAKGLATWTVYQDSYEPVDESEVIYD